MKKLLIAFMLLAAVPAGAATIEAGETYSLGQGVRVGDNLYTVGRTVVLAGEVVGDVVAAGEKLTIAGQVADDVLGAAGDISILGSVAGDVRIATSDASISGRIGGDLVVFAGTVHLLSGSTVGGDLIIMGGEVSIEGAVAGTVRAKAGKLTLRNATTGAIEADAGSVVLSGSRVRGDFIYSAGSEASIDSTSVIEGRTEFTKVNQESAAGAFAAVGGLFFVGKFFALLLATLILYWLARRFTKDVGTMAVASWGRNTLWGFVTLLVPLVLSLVLMVTVVGMVLGFLGLIGGAFILLLAKILSAVAAGAILSRVLVKEARVTPAWIILGALFIEVLVFIPLVGWIANGIIYLMALGTLGRMAMDMLSRARAESSTPSLDA